MHVSLGLYRQLYNEREAVNIKVYDMRVPTIK